MSADAFTCPHCGRTSRNPNDVREGYCGACHWWTGVPELYEPWLAERGESPPGDADLLSARPDVAN